MTWDEVSTLCTKIAEHVRTNYLDIKLVAGVNRGGLIPGQVIAYKLGIPFKAVDDSYDLIDYAPNKVLLIDDVCDTGETLSKFKISPYTNQYNTAVLIGKPWLTRSEAVSFLPDFTAEWLTEWVVFPWER